MIGGHRDGTRAGPAHWGRTFVSSARRFRSAALGIVVVAGGVAGYAAPAQGTTPGDSSGVITGGLLTNNQLNSYESVSPDGSGAVTWAPDGGTPGGGLTYSPDGTRIAFYGFKQLWVARADGTQAHPVANVGGLGFEGRPAWSADGRSIFYQDTSRNQYPIGTGTGACDIVIDRAQADGAQVEPIASLPSPGGPGDCPIFVATLSASVTGDVAISFNGYWGTKIWHHADGSLTDFTVPNLIPSEADYSPDGASLVFVGNGDARNRTNYPAGIYVAGVTSGTLSQIVSYGSNPNVPGTQHDFRSPVWAPDGSAVAYTDDTQAISPSPENHLEIYSFATKSSREITGVHLQAPLAWRPRTAALPPPALPTVDRIGGGDRIATAIDASRFEFAAATSTDPSARKATCAVLSRSDNYADALSGSALAGSKGCPLLLTPSNALPQTVVDELHRVLPKAATVYVLGGSAALSPAIDTEVTSAGFTPHRLSGTNRYETSIAIAREISAHPTMVLVATGDDFPDALTAGAVASSRGDAVVLTLPKNKTTDTARAYITSAMANPSTALVAVGMPGYTSVATIYPQSQLNSWILQGSGRFYAAAGGTRYSTASALFECFGLVTHRNVALATGRDWADALAGGSVAGLNNALLLLTDGTGLPDGQTQYLGPRQPTKVNNLLVFGGPSAVPARAVAALESATGVNGWSYFENRQTPTLR